jgi:GTP cyclohydrolase III
LSALPGRMATRQEGEVLVVDNANSGTNAATSIEAARYARTLSAGGALTLVIGEEARAVCEGFSQEEIERAVREIRPAAVVYVGAAWDTTPEPHTALTLAEGLEIARTITPAGSIVLAVKTWR